ncbi:MAG: ABC transporter substrate-binding protein [Chloroflexales bacterium]|nr:ABC transporter substrate-binding protein [Chloroflexales bacterium]
MQEILVGEAEAAKTSAESYLVTIMDMHGRELKFDAAPQRIVCLLNRYAQELAFIGVAPVAVGAPWTFNVARDPINFGEQAETFGQITQDLEIDWEQVAAYQPDLIIGEDTMQAAAEEIAPLYALSWDASVGETIENFMTDVRNYGRIFGIEAEVDAKIQNVLDRLDADYILISGLFVGNEENQAALDEIFETPLWQSLSAVQAGNVHISGVNFGGGDNGVMHYILDELAEAFGVEDQLSPNPYAIKSEIPWWKALKRKAIKQFGTRLAQYRVATYTPWTHTGTASVCSRPIRSSTICSAF